MNDRLKQALERFKDNELIETVKGRVAIDRSVGVVLFAWFIEKGDLYFLICRRGTKTSEEAKKWNLPSGYLGWNEDGEEAAARECWEETGIEVDPREVLEIEHSTSPKENRQNIIFRYAVNLRNGPKEVAVDNNEATEAKFIKLSEIENYDFAWTQKETIIRLSRGVY